MKTQPNIIAVRLLDRSAAKFRVTVSRRHGARAFLFLLLAAVLAGAVYLTDRTAASAVAAPGATQRLASPNAVPQGLASSEWRSIREAHEAWRLSMIAPGQEAYLKPAAVGTTQASDNF